MRAPPSGPCEHDWIATGLFSNGWSFMRETQSIAFLSTPGIDQLYSGVTNSTPSAARIAAGEIVGRTGKAGGVLDIGVVKRKRFRSSAP